MEHRTLANWLFDASAIFVAVVLAELVVLLLHAQLGGASSLLAAVGTPPQASYSGNVEVST